MLPKMGKPQRFTKGVSLPYIYIYTTTYYYYTTTNTTIVNVVKNGKYYVMGTGRICRLCKKPMALMEVKMKRHYSLWTCHFCTGSGQGINQELVGLERLYRAIKRLGDLAPESLLAEWEKSYSLVASQLQKRLDDKGYVLIVLMGDTVALVQDGRDPPPGYIWYTVSELEMLEYRLPLLVHEAKRHGGRISSVEGEKGLTKATEWCTI